MKGVKPFTYINALCPKKGTFAKSVAADWMHLIRAYTDCMKCKLLSNKKEVKYNQTLLNLEKDLSVSYGRRVHKVYLG